MFCAVALAITTGMVGSGAIQLPSAPVIRATLDGRDRSIIVPLSPNLTVAYDATTCRLRRVWNGALAQEKSTSDAYAEDALMNPTWRIRSGSASDRVVPIFRGYRVRNQVVTLMYDLPFQGTSIRIEETPSLQDNILTRDFNPIRLPKDMRLSLTVPLDLSEPATTSGSLTDVEEPGMRPSSALLALRNDGPTRISTTFKVGSPGKMTFPPSEKVATTSALPPRPFPFATSLVADVPLDATCFVVGPGGRSLAGDRNRVFVLGTGKVIANGLDECRSLQFAAGRLLALQKYELTELIDFDGDQVTDEYRVIVQGWPVQTARDFTLTHESTMIVTGDGVLSPRPDGSMEAVTETIPGATTLSLGPNGQRLISAPGAFVPWTPSQSPIQIPSDASPSNLLPLTFKPFAQQYAFGLRGAPGIWRWIPETVDGHLQGAMLPISNAFGAQLSGTNFLAFGGGQLTSVRPKPEAMFEVTDVNLFANGFEFVLSESIVEGMGLSPQDYWVKTKAGQTLSVESVTVNRWRNRVFLEIPGLQPGMMVQVLVNPGLTSTANRQIGARDFWYPIARIPAQKVAAVAPSKTPADGPGFTVLSFESVASGLRSLNQFANFDFRFSWRDGDDGPTSLFLRVPPEANPAESSLQVNLTQDKANAGSLMGLENSRHNPVRERGQWNDSRILFLGGSLEHWLNGYRVWRFNLANVHTKARIAQSPMGQFPDFARAKSGYLQFNSGKQSAANLRNLRMRRL